MRLNERYVVDLPCSILGQTGEVIPGTLHDVSAGGVGLRVEDWRGWSTFAVRVRFMDEEMELPVELRHLTSVWTRLRLHCQFRLLTSSQQRFVDRLIAAAERESHPSLRRWLGLGRKPHRPAG